MKLPYESTEYTGKYITPYTMIDGLTWNVDYSLKYVDNMQPGIAKIIITGMGNYEGTLEKTFEITKMKQNIKADKIPVYYEKGKTFNLNAASDGPGLLSYTSSDENVVKVNENGVITTVGSGKATITINAAETELYQSAELKIEVNLSIGNLSQVITASNITKTYSKNATFNLGVKRVGDGKLNYTSSNTKVAKVDANGKITVVGCGTAKITIKASATALYKPASKTISVTIKRVQNITAASASRPYKYNKRYSLGAKAKGKLTYKSSNSKVVAVSSNGNYYIKGIGTAKITISAASTSQYGTAKKTVTITVYPATNTFTKYRSPSRRTIKLAWKKDTKVTGYELQISTNSKFTSVKVARANRNQTTTTIRGLKSGKRYYVRIRSYKQIGASRNYGKWSRVKGITVK